MSIIARCAYNREETVNLKLTVPKDRPYSQPFWLRDAPDGERMSSKTRR